MKPSWSDWILLSKLSTQIRLEIKQRLALFSLPLLTFSAYATFPDVDSMLQSYRPVAQVAAPTIYRLTLALDAARPYGETRHDILLTLVPLADGSLWAASEGPMRQVNSIIHDRLMRVAESAESGYTSGDAMQSVSHPKPITVTPHTKLDSKVEEMKAEKEEKAVKEKEERKKTSTLISIIDIGPPLNTPGEEAVPIEEPVKYQDLSKAKDIKGAWIQLLGNDIRHQDKGGVPGYHAQILGVLIGRDLEIIPAAIFGLAGGYQQGDVKQIAFTGSFLDIKRLHTTAYGRYHFLNHPLYMQGTLTFAHNRYDSSRLVLVPPFNGQGFVGYANADFTGWETDVYLEAGILNKINQFRNTPKIFVNYAHLDVHGYKEADMFGLNLNVKYEHLDALSLGTGIKLDYVNAFNNVNVIPEAHGYVLYDFINESQRSTANFLGGGYAFLSQGPQPGAITYEAGASLTIHSHTNTMIKIGYDLATRSEYFRQGVMIKIRHEWV